jgi:hypothetical protein
MKFKFIALVVHFILCQPNTYALKGFLFEPYKNPQENLNDPFNKEYYKVTSETDEFIRKANENKNSYESFQKYSNEELENTLKKLNGEDEEYKFREPTTSLENPDKGYKAHSYSVPIDSIYRKTSDGSYVPKYDSYKGTTGIGNIQERQFFMIILIASISFLVLIVFLFFYAKKKKNHVDFKEMKKN